MKRLMRVNVALWSTLLVLAWTSVAAAQTPPRQVLLIYSYERDFAPHLAFTELFRPALIRRSPEPLEFVEVSLQAARASHSAPDDSMVAQIQSMLAGRQPDLVVPIGGPAALFAQRNRDQLFPEAAMLVAGVDRRFVENDAITENDAVVAVDHEPTRLVENILTLLPDTRTVFVVVGASHLEQVWLDEMKSAFRRFDGKVTFSWGNDLSFADMVTRAAHLPSHSAILFAILSIDSKGVPYVENEALAKLHASANAPIFGVRSTQLGRGIVGGPLMSVEDMSQNTAEVALHLLNGESPRTLRAPTQRLATPVYDARELRRWNIDERRLPSGSIIQFRELTVWERYKRPIVAASAFTGVQAILVGGLVVTLGRRRRAERLLRESERRFRTLSNAAPVMLWMTDGVTKRTDFNRSWLDFTGESNGAEREHGGIDAVHPDDVANCLETYSHAFDRREPFRLECRVRRHDGEYRWFLETGVPRFLADGRFAGYVGSAIDVTDLKLARVALSSLNRRLMQAHERERASIAKELQDGLCQRMIVLTMRLHSLSQTSGGGEDEEVRRNIETLSSEFADLASEIFAISDQLHSSKLELMGLAAASRGLCRELAAQHDVKVEFDDGGIPDGVSSDIALALFQVMQQALRNAVKHSAASRVAVSIYGSHSEIRLDVVDEGVGFDPDAVMNGHGLGLLAMKERLNLVGGECTIESRPGAGTRIRARVPLTEPTLTATARDIDERLTLGRMETQ